MLRGSLGMALYCYLDPNAFGDLGKEVGINFRLFFFNRRPGPPGRSRIAYAVARTAQPQPHANLAAGTNGG